MKKFLKYAGIGLGSLVLLLFIAAAGIYFYYQDWAEFNYYMRHNDIASMQKMLDDGYNINKDLKYYKISHLHIAISESKTVNNDTIEFLINNGVDINYVSKMGTTPFIRTMMVQRPDIAKILVNKGAKFDTVIKNRTITEMAIIKILPEFIMLIPKDEISVGPNFVNEPYLTEIARIFYKKGKTDRRVIDYLEKNNLLPN